MLDKRATETTKAKPAGPPLDFQEHLARLEAAGLLRRIDRAINKDTELHPLVRWQFQGGFADDERRAFLFTNVVDSEGRRYDIPVAIGALLAQPAVPSVIAGRGGIRRVRVFTATVRVITINGSAIRISSVLAEAFT